MPTAQVNGAEIYYEEVGSGLPLILSPGGLQGVLASYQPVIKPLPASGARMRVSAALFGLYAPDALTAHVSVFAHDVKRCKRLTKLASSSQSTKQKGVQHGHHITSPDHSGEGQTRLGPALR